MEVAGAVTRRGSLLRDCRTEPFDRRKACLVASVNVGNLRAGNHMQLALKRQSITCGERKEKKKQKLMKVLEKYLASFASMGFGIDRQTGLAGEVQGSTMMEAAEVLLRQVQCLRESKREKKLKEKSMGMVEDVVSESSTDSDQLVSENRVAGELLQSLDCVEKEEQCGNKSTVKVGKRVEICVSGKCRKSGASQLLEQIQKVAEEEVDVVGCKCMGNCKNGPNLRLSATNAAPAICSRVEISDVDSLMARFLELQ